MGIDIREIECIDYNLELIYDSMNVPEKKVMQAGLFGYVKPISWFTNPKIRPSLTAGCTGVVKSLVLTDFLANSENLCISYDRVRRWVLTHS